MRRNSLKALYTSHTPGAIHQRLADGPAHSHLRDFIYGAIDGAVTTFAVAAGVVGAELSGSVVLILGLANLVADGFSMAASNFLGTKAEAEQRERTRAEELRHIQILPDGEREEIRQILARKGFSGDDLEQAVKIITGDVEQWVDMMIQDEHGLPLTENRPVKAALITFGAFVIVGAIPLAPFWWEWMAPGAIHSPFLWSAMATCAAFFGVGALKSRYTGQSWPRCGVETLIIGSSAAALAYGIGVLLKGLAG